MLKMIRNVSNSKQDFGVEGPQSLENVFLTE